MFHALFREDFDSTCTVWSKERLKILCKKSRQHNLSRESHLRPRVRCYCLRKSIGPSICVLTEGHIDHNPTNFARLSTKYSTNTNNISASRRFRRQRHWNTDFKFRPFLRLSIPLVKFPNCNFSIYTCVFDILRCTRYRFHFLEWSR